MTDRADLIRGLARTSTAPTDSKPTRTAIPSPSRHLISRAVLPGAILLAFAVVLGVVARDSLWPARVVQVEPVVSREIVADTATSSATNPENTADQAASPTRSGLNAVVPAGSPDFQAAGWIEPDPFPTAVSALADGVVREMLVLEGQRVERDQVVARMVDDDARLEADRARAELARATANLAAKAADLVAATAEWENPVERNRALAAARAAHARAEAALVHLERRIEVAVAAVAELEDQERREKRVADSAVFPESQHAQTVLRLATRRAELESARAEAQIFAAERESAAAEVIAAEEGLRLRISERRDLDAADAEHNLAAAERDLAAASLAEAELRLARMEVRAPVAGVVLKRLAGPGAKLMLGMDSPESAHPIWLYDPESLQVRVDIPLADAGKVSVGQHARIIVEVLPDRTFAGEVTRIVNEADLQKNTMQVKVAIAAPDSRLKPEMLARVGFYGSVAPATPAGEPAEESADGTRALFVREALLERDSNGGAHAWIVDKGQSTAHRVAVEIGTRRHEDWIEARAGLAPGDLVIITPTPPLAEGERIKTEIRHGAH